MKKILTFILSAASILAAQSCCEIEDGWTDIDSWPAPAKKYEPRTDYTFNHPCMLHSASDLDYTKSHLGQEPWAEAYNKLLTSDFCNANYKPSPVEYLARLDAGNWGDGGGRWDDAGIRDLFYPGIHNNYVNFYQDCAAAYQLGLKWKLAGDGQAAAAAINILQEWAKVNKGLLLGRGPRFKDEPVDPNEYLIMFQIHQAANAAELVRDFNDWDKSDEFKQVVTWMTEHFYPFCSKFIATNINDHSWMNWDLASMTAMLSIAILGNDMDKVNEAILHFKMGLGPGCIMRKGVIEVSDDPSGTGEKLAQGNESGRDQGHNVLCAAMLGAFCQMAYNIGEDLFSFEDGRAIAFAQYIAKYNLVKPELGKDYDSGNLTDASFRYPESSMPFKEYSYNGGTMTKISAAGRGNVRPCWDLWAGYCKSHNVKATYIQQMAEHFRPDGGGGHYGGNSGGFDQLGFSTLMHHRE